MISLKALKCCNMKNPIGIDEEIISFSWEIDSNDIFLQDAIVLQISSSCSNFKQNLVFESGEIVCEKNRFDLRIPFQVNRGDQFFWRVKSFGHALTQKVESNWSDINHFEIGIVGGEVLDAKWITAGYQGYQGAPIFRKEFQIPDNIVKARLIAGAGGYYHIELNGEMIGDILEPAPTAYDKKVYYNIYDVTEAIASGTNCFGVMVGNGWYNDFTSSTWALCNAPWRSEPRVILQLELTDSDGAITKVCTDSSWKVSKGPITYNALRSGEHYDARLYSKNWNHAGFDDSGWNNAVNAPAPGGVLHHANIPPIRKQNEIVPAAVSWVDNKAVFDFGQAFSGVVRLSIRGKNGQQIEMRYGEQLNDDGSLNRDDLVIFNNMSEFQTDSYICNGEGAEAWEPVFTYHGFRYVEVSGLERKPELDMLTGISLYTDADITGSFSCDNLLFNKIFKAAINSSKYNLHAFPTDCPHREKLGWTGDAWVSSEQMLLNFDITAVYYEWLLQFKDAQRPSGQLPGIIPTGGWGFNWGNGPTFDLAVIMIPWNVYLYTGNTRLIEALYPNMIKYMAFLSQMAQDGILEYGLGDWCPPGKVSDDYRVPLNVVSTAFYYYGAFKLAKILKVLNHRDAEKYLTLSDSIKKAFNANFVDQNTGVVKGSSQASQTLAISLGLLDEGTTELAGARLREYCEAKHFHIDTGIFATKFIFEALKKTGHSDIIYKMINQEDYPSWGYMLKDGSEVLWEKWAGHDSRLHHMLSSVVDTFYKVFAGINPVEESPGFYKVLINPIPCELTSVSANVKTPQGEIAISYEITGDIMIILLRLPTNVNATIDRLDYGVVKSLICVKSGEKIDKTAINGNGIYKITVKRH